MCKKTIGFKSKIAKNKKIEFSYNDQLLRIPAQGYMFAMLKYVNISKKRYIITGN